LIKLNLSNEYHNTTASCIPQPITDGRYKGYYRISRKVARRLHNQLCGCNDCVCGGTFGQRGGLYVNVINEDYDNSYIINCPNGELA
jgi:hypothetical protein